MKIEVSNGELLDKLTKNVNVEPVIGDTDNLSEK